MRKMRIEVRSDCVVLDGYVNAVARDSRPINTVAGRVVEQIKPGTFKNALEKAKNVSILLDHDEKRKLGSIEDGNLELFEDDIGLRAIAMVNDEEIISKAKKKLLKGWSFGMYVNKDIIEERGNDIPRRIVTDIDLFEVSIIDERMTPCYTGTSIETRANKEVEVEHRSNKFTAITENLSSINYSEYENRIKALHQA